MQQMLMVLIVAPHKAICRHSVCQSTGAAAAPKTAVEEMEGMPQQHFLGKPFVEVQWEMLQHNPSILYFRALLLQIQVNPKLSKVLAVTSKAMFHGQA